MRKRLFLCIIGCLSSITMIWGQHISEEQALQKAQAFMQGKVKNSAINGRKGAPAKALAMHRVTQDVPTDAYYIFNTEQNGGFVIVSGDERTEEILGYSTEGHIDPQQMPENMRAWLKGYEEQIESIPANATTTSASMPTHPAVEPLLTCKWNQGAPYNLQCPTQIPEGGTEPQHCVTGCTATAMAQIMYYWKWPQDYTTSIPAYGYGRNGYKYKYHADELPPVKFDWANMKDIYDGSETDASADAVAQLMHYCGQSVKMDYGLDGSGAALNTQPLVNFFGYDNGATYVKQSNYNIQEWDAMIYQEIEAGRPIWYAGYNITMPHAFVCDGYDGNGSYHFNWGWGGYYDGYFKLNVHSSSDYLTDQYAIVGIQMPTEENARNYYSTYFSIIDERNFNGNVHLYCVYSNLSNWDGLFDGGYMIECMNGTYTKTIHNLFSNLLIKGNYSHNCSIDLLPLNLPDGDYRLRLIMKESSSSEWHQYSNRYVDFSITEGAISSLKTDPIINIEGTIQPQGNLVTNEIQRLDVNFINHGDEFNRYVYLFVSQTENMGKAVAINSLAIEEGSEETIYFEYTFPQAGTYHVWVVSYNNVILAQADLTISNPINIEMLGYIDWDSMTIPITVRNFDNIPYEHEVAIRIYPREDTGKSESGTVLKSEKLHIEPGQSVDVSFDCLDLCIDNLYMADYMYCKNPNNNVLSTNYRIPLYTTSKGSFNINGLEYSIVDTEHNYVFANRYYPNESSQLTVPAKVISPIDGVSYTVKGVSFYFCTDTDLDYLTFSNGITTIENWAIVGCESLETIVLPASVRRIGEPMIYGCSNLKTIFSKAYEAPLLVGDNYGEIDYLIARNNQHDEITLYVPKGSRDSYVKAWPQFTNIVEMDVDDMPGELKELGDLNGDGSVSITDVVLIIDVIAGTITDAMSVKAADVNQDGNVTITDCVAAIDLIAVQNMAMHMNRASANPISSDYISASMEDRLLTVSLENENHYTAFQMVVALPNGMTIDKASIDYRRGSDHQLAVRNIGNGKYLVAGFSMDNNELMGNSGRLLNITTNGQAKGDIVISDIEFTTTEGESFHLNPINISSDATGISQIKMSEWETDDVIFDLQGRRVNHPSRGLYIVNGSKLIVK